MYNFDRQIHRRSVSPDIAREYIAPLGLFDYLEVSAKTGQHIETLFEILVKHLT